MRNRVVTRMIGLLATLQRAQRSGRTLASLADEFGVCERTIRRDLDALQEMHLPVTRSDDLTNARWGILSANCPLCGRKDRTKGLQVRSL